MSDKKRKIPKKWENEIKAVKATQVAFDVGEQVQYVIRKEALDRNINPSDRIRQILGLKVSRKPKRLRLSISLSDEDLSFLAERYELETKDPVEVKRRAAEKLVRHARNNKEDSKEENKENNNNNEGK